VQILTGNWQLATGNRQLATGNWKPETGNRNLQPEPPLPFGVAAAFRPWCIRPRTIRLQPRAVLSMDRDKVAFSRKMVAKSH